MSFFAELGLSAAFTMISLAPMVPEWSKGNPEPQTKINVMAGLPRLTSEQQGNREKAYEDLSFGGCAPEIALFNPNGDRVGFSRNKGCDNYIDQNNPKDLWADYLKEGNTEKAEYITVSAVDIDAICIAAVAVTYPTSSDTYAFLPGEMAAVCKDYNPKFDYYWSESESTVQFRDPKSGKTQGARPKCLWIDRADDDGDKATHIEGFQVHLPDFKLDNSTYKGWQENPGQMCDSLARFGGYDTLNVMMCPQIFSPAPMFGESLPLKEVSACFPTVVPDDQGKIYPDPCDNPHLAYQDRYNILQMYGNRCPSTSRYQWWVDCGYFGGECSSQRRSIPEAYSSSSFSTARHRRRSLPTENGFASSDHPLQKRFAGRLVKSRDVTQSAVHVCESKGSVGPDFYSEHEQMFCNMKERKLYPACKSEGELGCFDLVYNETRIGGHQKRREQSAYLHVEEWL